MVVQAIREMVLCVVKERLIKLVEELDGGNVAGSPRFLENSCKTSHTISHSCSISVMSFCRLAWKEKMVKVVEVLIDQVQGGVWRE